MDENRESLLAEKLAALDKWADEVGPADLKPAPLESLGAIAVLMDLQEEVNRALAQAVADAKSRGRTWSQISSMLGISKQPAYRKYGAMTSAQSLS